MDVNETISSASAKLVVEITEKTTDEQVTNLLHAACQAFSSQQTTLSRFQLLVGRVLVVIRERKLFKAAYKTFDRYMLAEVIDKYGISRATVWTGLQIAQTVPEVSVEEATKIGVVKMRDIARAIKREEKASKLPHPKDKTVLVDRLLKLARKETATDFRKSLEASNLLQPRTSPSRQNVIVVRTTSDLVAQWTDYVGERNPDEVLRELLDNVPARIPRRRAATKAA